MAALAIAGLLLCACLYGVAANPAAQWDFEVYYSAAHALAGGRSPYLPVHIPGMRGDAVFQYPPLALLWFRWTLWFSLSGAKLVWLALKLAAVACLLRLWHRRFESLPLDLPTVLIVAFGFNSTLLRDLTSGNIGCFEQLGLWWGFALMLEGRPYLAALSIACVAEFKLLPICFLALLPVVRPRDGWKAALAGCALFAGLLASSALLWPDLSRSYAGLFDGANLRMDDRNLNNPSSLALFRDLVDLTALIPGFDWNRIGADCAYGCWLLLLGLIVVQAASKRRRLPDRLDPRLATYIAAALYTVAMPRMKDYSYSIMLLPALHVLKELGRRARALNPAATAAVLMVLAQPQQTNVPGMAPFLTLTQAYLPLLVALAVLAGLLAEASPGPGPAAARV